MPGVRQRARRRTSSAREVELKFLVDPRALGVVERLPALRRIFAKSKPAKLISTYFDTEDRRLEKAGLTMRLRVNGTKHILTVKNAEKAAIGRGEWERAVKGDRPCAADYATSPAGAALGNDDASLIPLFTSTVERCATIVNRKGSRIEAARDLGKIVWKDEELPICEIELELKRGKPAELIAFARLLLAEAPLHLSFVSKAERGQRLAAGTWGKPQSASVPALNLQMTALTALLTIGRTCLHDFMLNEPALTPPADIEDVHQARIAIRRLRAAMSLFAPLIEHPQVEHLKGEIKWLADLLGAARDLDVTATDPAIPPGSKLAAAIAGRREIAHRTLATGLDSSRMRLLLLDLASWLDEANWPAARRRRLVRPVPEIAGELLGGRLRKLAKRAHDLDRLGARKRHRVRINAKKLRYMCGFFASLIDDGKAQQRFKQLTKTLEKLQDSLGTLQDEVTFSALLADLTAEEGEAGALQKDVRQAAKRAKQDRKGELRKAQKAGTKLGTIKPFWLKL